jgi:VIT1/CCC1 family predicted Fe2+/Mn2+ transporter
LLAQTLPDEVTAVLTEEQLERVRVTLKQAPAPIPPTPGVRDLLAGLAVASLVFGSTLPIALPFLLFHQDGQLAMRVSNGIAIAMLFVAGALYARVVGGRAWLIGAVMVVLGIALVAMTIALGG